MVSVQKCFGHFVPPSVLLGLRFFMIPYGFLGFFMVPYDSLGFLMVPDGSIWFFMATYFPYGALQFLRVSYGICI